MANVLFGIFLLVHGLIHLGWVTPKPADPNYPFDTASSRLLPFLPARVLGPLSIALVAAILLAFAVAALGLFGVPGPSQIWGAAAVAGSGLSLVACLVFWHPWFAAGPLIDVAIILSVAMGLPKAG